MPDRFFFPHCLQTGTITLAFQLCAAFSQTGYFTAHSHQLLRGGLFLRFQFRGEVAGSVTFECKLTGARLRISDGLLKALLQCFAGGQMLLAF